jgi:hypothetical protein
MDKDRHRRDGQRALGLMQAIATPIRLRHSLGDRAARLLIEQWDTVCKAQELNRFVLAGDQMIGAIRAAQRLLHVAVFVDFDASVVGSPISDRDFDLERIAAIGRGGTRCDGKEIRLKFLVQSLEQPLLADRNNAIGSRR